MAFPPTMPFPAQIVGPAALDVDVDDDDADDDIGLTLPPSVEDMLDQEDGAAHMFPPLPPSHLIDRFYRPSTARRRGSAASSRRNSISSAHSRCSSQHRYHPHRHRHCAGQSTLVAQHLRRASFLADRQARLADRAAHAEKVRLRAALAKSSSQQRDALVSAERALAAQQARERNLAEITAACAEEVKRAKAIAESMKERREAELATRRAQMEERHAEAERRRREELRSRSSTAISRRARGHSVTSRKVGGVEVLPQVRENGEGEPEPSELSEPSEPDQPEPDQIHARRPAGLLSAETAAGRIQWWWRGQSRRRALREFTALEITVDRARATAFETVTDLMMQNTVIHATARVLRICGLDEGAAVGSVEEMAATRTFLSAFLILGHPREVLGSKDADQQREQDLVASARDQLICFENILSRLTGFNNYTPPPSQRRLLPRAYAAWHDNFLAWKSRDKAAVIETMLLQFVELDAIWQTVNDATDDPAPTEAYRDSIRENQVKIMVRIKRLAGDRAKKLVSDAVMTARRERAAKQQQQQQQQQHQKAIVKPRGVTVAGEGANEAGAAAVAAVAPPAAQQQQQHQQTGADPAAAAAAAAAAARSVALVPALSGLLPDNRVIMHELAIDHEYVIPTDEFREHQAINLLPVLLQMRIALGDDDNFFSPFRLFAQSIKERLQRTVAAGCPTHRLIDELLDMDLAEQQFRVGSFSYDRYIGSVGTLLPQLCAPFRDDELRDLAENGLRLGDLVDRLVALSGFVDSMLCDYVNYLLRMVGPGLIGTAAAYETARFRETTRQLSALSAAETAWRTARAKLLLTETITAGSSSSQPQPRPRLSGDRIYYQVLVDVFTQPLPAAPNQVPEMLRLDASRIPRISAAVRRIVTAGAILVQCKNLLKRSVQTPWRAEAGRVMAVLAEASSPGGESRPSEVLLVGVMAALESGRAIPAVTRAQLRTLVTKVLAASAAAAQGGEDPREPVLHLLLTRLRANIFARLSTASASAERERQTSVAGERLAGLGLGEFVDAVRAISDELARIGSVDRAAHSEWWDQVAETVEREEQ